MILKYSHNRSFLQCLSSEHPLEVTHYHLIHSPEYGQFPLYIFLSSYFASNYKMWHNTCTQIYSHSSDITIQSLQRPFKLVFYCVRLNTHQSLKWAFLLGCLHRYEVSEVVSNILLLLWTNDTLVTGKTYFSQSISRKSLFFNILQVKVTQKLKQSWVLFYG